MTLQTARAEPARKRERWPVRIYRLGEEPVDDLCATTTPAERIEMVWPLTLDAWAFSRRPLPSYSRAEMPAKRVSQAPVADRRTGR